jgi:pimeloyl-ACP methyl ester carboxylesterase
MTGRNGAGTRAVEAIEGCRVILRSVPRRPVPPLEPGWVVVDGVPMYHRWNPGPGSSAAPIVHVHGFGISGTYLEPTAARLAARYRTYVPDLPGMGRSLRRDRPLDIPGLAGALMSYCDAVGVERATFVGNSLGCPILVEVSTAFPERIERAVLVSPAGGANNRPLPRALGQMAVDGLREPPSMVAIAVRDYLRFGVIQSVALFAAMTRRRDPLVSVDRAHVFSALPHVDAVRVPGAHALNYTAPELIAELVDAHVRGEPLSTDAGPRSAVETLRVDRRAAGAPP